MQLLISLVCVESQNEQTVEYAKNVNNLLFLDLLGTCGKGKAESQLLEVDGIQSCQQIDSIYLNHYIQ